MRRAYYRCSRILILCLLCISVSVPVFLVSYRLKHNSFASRKYVEDLSIIKHRTEAAQTLNAIEQEESEGFREPQEVYKVDSPVVHLSSSEDTTFDEYRDADSSGNNVTRDDPHQEIQKEDKLLVSEAKKEQSHVRVVRRCKESTRRALDEKLKEMKDQVIRARAYINFTPTNSSSHFVKELKLRVKELERVISQSTRDSRITRSAPQKMKAMETSLLKASRIYPDCAAMVKKLRAMTYNAEEQVRSQRSQEVFLKGLGARTIPKGLHCLSMRLTADYFALEAKERELPNQHKLRYPDHYHFAIFSDNVLACSVVVNSTTSLAREPEKVVFHIVTDALNFPAMSMWFLSNPPGKATVSVESIDNFQRLSTKYHVSFQKEGAVDPRFTSELNHLRFYLPDVFPHLNKIVFLDHDVVVQRDLTRLWDINTKGKVNAAVQTCDPADPSYHRMDVFINFTDPVIAERFNRNACTWAFGMNIFDLKRWRRRDLTAVYHKYRRLLTFPEPKLLLSGSYSLREKMATISACTSTSSVARAAFVQKPSAFRPVAIVALPAMRSALKVKCSMEAKPQESESKLGMGASLIAAACAAAMSSPSAMALVDERMSTEGTGLPFGLSSNLLGWILLGVFGLIWTFYFTYASSLDEDEESGLSL